MKKKLVHNFTIKIATPTRVIKTNKVSKVSRKCYAVVIEDNGEMKARVTSSPVKESDSVPSEFLMLPFTENSLNLKGKLYVFTYNKDKYNHNVCIIRDTLKAMFHYGNQNMYRALRPGLLIAGHVVKQQNKHYFDYEQLIAFSEFGRHINDVKINEDTPLFDF